MCVGRFNQSMSSMQDKKMNSIIRGDSHRPLPSNCRVSIIIKALNEEKLIAETIESALRAVSRVGGEVILADSCSTDRTVE